MKDLDPEIIKKNKIVQHTVNGISHFLILWTIMENGPIHGYRLMKELNLFFEELIDVGVLRKSSPSRVYPILNDMEKNGLIKGEIKTKDNKKVKYYEITDFGETLLYSIRDYYLEIKLSPRGQVFSDFLNDK